MGKYDFVEQVLADLGAEFYFQSVALRPGKPLVFGRVAGKFFFGLPGNPDLDFCDFRVICSPGARGPGRRGFCSRRFFCGRAWVSPFSSELV